MSVQAVSYLDKSYLLLSVLFLFSLFGMTPAADDSSLSTLYLQCLASEIGPLITNSCNGKEDYDLGCATHDRFN